MLAEFLRDRGDWTQVMPGARACLFSLRRGAGFPAPPAGASALRGPVLPGRVNDPDPAGRLDPDGRGTAGAPPHRPLRPDRRQRGRPSGGRPGGGGRPGRPGEPETICGLLGGLTLDTGQVRRWMAGRGGCAVEGPTHWSRAAFADLDRLPPGEQARWCVWKSVELLYLLSAPETGGTDTAPALDREVARALAETRRYMEEHLDEPLTISGPEPPGLPLRHHLQGGLPPPVRPARPHLAAAAADGAGGGAAAGLLSQRAGGGPVGGIRQRQPVHRRLPAAVRRDAGPIPEKCLNRHNPVRFGDTGSIPYLYGIKFTPRIHALRHKTSPPGIVQPNRQCWRFP